MNKDSLSFSATLNYLITVVLLFLAFLILFANETHIKEEQAFSKYEPLIKMIHRQKPVLDENLKSILQEMNYEVFFDKDIDEILKKSKKILIERGKFVIFEIDGKNYILFDRHGLRFLVKDNEELQYSHTFYLVVVFIILFFVLTFLYFRTLKKLEPLKELKIKVTSLASENFDFDIKDSDNKDEISLLANEFKKTAQKLKNIKEARNVFIRNIMHELKTPITKGKFLLQLEKSEENSEKLKKVFNRLESLINEFATIEELISQNKTLELKGYFLEDLIDNAKDILMLDDECIENEYTNIKLNVNFKLFSIAIKNLIDNAIKYSKDKRVLIKTENEDIIFINSGKKLEGDFEKYLEPFYSKDSKESFGLGLYIVFNILKANGYNLQYRYEDSNNIFIIKKDKNF